MPAWPHSLVNWLRRLSGDATRTSASRPGTRVKAGLARRQFAGLTELEDQPAIDVGRGFDRVGELLLLLDNVESAIEAADTQKLTAQLSAAEAYVKRAERCQPPELRSAFVDAMWDLVRELRRRRRYVEALRSWTLIRLSSDSASPEVVLLASTIARTFQKESSLHDYPEPLRCVLLAVVEALHVLGSSSEPEVKASLAGLLHDVLRIDWEDPASADLVSQRLAILQDLRPCIRHLPPALASDFGFWLAMGHWRMSATIDEYREVERRFAMLQEQHPENCVYRWCHLRVIHETTRQDDAVAIADELKLWPLARSEDPAVLARYFEAIMEAEHLLGLRAGARARAVSESKLRAALLREPALLRDHSKLRRHVSPILDQVDAALSRAR